MRIVVARPALAALVADGARAVEGASILDALDERSRSRLLLAVRRVAMEVALPAPGRVDAVLVVRAALVGDSTWLHLHERKVHPQPRHDEVSEMVGRRSALAEMCRYLTDRDGAVLFVRGPLGIGKTTLLRAFAARCEELACPLVWIDARTTPPTEQAIFDAIARGAGPRGTLAAARRLAQRRWVLVIDNFDAWQSGPETGAHALSLLPLDCRVVVAVRGAPVRRWWEAAMRAPRPLVLGVLSPAEAEELEARTGIAPSHAGEVRRRAAGHPLCIVTLGAAIRSGLAPTATLIPAGIDFVEPERRDVLDAAAIPARITEDVMAALVEPPAAASEAFDFLGTICVPDGSGVGLRMPAVLRDALRARLRERSPARLTALQARLTGHYGALLDSGEVTTLYPVLDDFLDALDDNPVVRRLAGGRADLRLEARRVGPDEPLPSLDSLSPLVDAPLYEGLARRWADRSVVTCLAEGDDGVLGVMQYALVGPAAVAASWSSGCDEAFDAALAVLRSQGPLAAEAPALVCVTWATGDGPPGTWGPASRALFRKLLGVLATTRAGATVFVQPGGEARLATLRFPGATSHHSDGFTVLYRDLRGVAPRRILETLIASNADPAPAFGVVPQVTTVVVTVENVREALANLVHPDKLASSPLLALRAVGKEAGPRASGAEKVEALARLLRDTLASVQGGSREAKEREVLEAVFLTKSGKHETMASDLGLAYSTFRRYLSRGVVRVAAALEFRERSVG